MTPRSTTQAGFTIEKKYDCPAISSPAIPKPPRKLSEMRNTAVTTADPMLGLIAAGTIARAVTAMNTP